MRQVDKEMNKEDQLSENENLEQHLIHLGDVLKREREALLAGDAKEVALLARDKEEIAQSLEECGRLRAKQRCAKDADSKKIKDLARSVAELAQLNHLLLQQMYQHYHGMVELVIKLAGGGTTYGADGLMNVQKTSLRNTKILA